MNTKTIRIITASVAGADALLAAGDKLIAIPLLPGWLTSAWPIILFATLAFDRVAHAILDSNKPN